MYTEDVKSLVQRLWLALKATRTNRQVLRLSYNEGCKAVVLHYHLGDVYVNVEGMNNYDISKKVMVVIQEGR